MSSASPTSLFFTGQNRPSKAVMYMVAAVFTLMIYLYIVNRFIAEDKRSQYVFDQMVGGLAGHVTGRGMDAATRYVFGI